MSHRQDLLGKGYRSWWKKGTELQMKNLGKKLKSDGKITNYVVAKCLMGMNKNKYELYVK